MSEGCRLSLSVEGLLAEARRRTGLDRADEDAVEPLTVLLRSLNEEARLSGQGAEVAQSRILRVLGNRLRLQRDLARHPEILDQVIAAPIIVYGMPRSGTTKLQKMLAASGDFNFLPFWQAQNFALHGGARGESPDARIADSEAYCSWYAEASPEMRRGHAYETHEPEEDTVLMQSSLRSHGWMAQADVPGYLEWMMGQDFLPTLGFLKTALKYLQWQGLASPAKRWLLKAPVYHGLEAQLLQLFPDATLVMMHRSPLASVPSACKLLEAFRKPFTDVPVFPAVLLEALAAQMDRHLLLRTSMPSLAVLDIYYDDNNRAPRHVVERVYAVAGMTLSDAAWTRISGWLDVNPQHKHGRFSYSLDEFGLERAQVHARFSGYDRFLRSAFPQMAAE